MASGINTAARPINLIKDAPKVGLIFASASLPRNVAPIEISANGEVITPIFDIVFLTIPGNLILKNDAIIPSTIPMMIGFVNTPIHALRMPFLSASLLVKVKMMTAKIL